MKESTLELKLAVAALKAKISDLSLGGGDWPIVGTQQTLGQGSYDESHRHFGESESQGNITSAATAAS